MSKAMQLVGIILLAIFTLVIIYLMSDVRSTNELDYYLLQEVTEASMYDAVDYSYYRETGLLKVDRDMFLESFNRRFAESVSNDRDYDIKIIDFNETPPKVSVEVSAPTVASVKGEVALVTNRVSGIIETIYDDFVYSKGDYGLDNYDDEAPEITVTGPNNNKYTITMTDNYMLDKYAIVELGSNGINQFTDAIYNNISNWTSIKGFVDSYTIDQSIASGKEGFWAVAVDRGGLWTAVPITDLYPLISDWTYPNNNKLKLTFKDDRGLASYTVYAASCHGTVSVTNKVVTCDGKWAFGEIEGAGGKFANVNVGDDNYYTVTKSIDVSQHAYYAITVTDSAGQVSEPKVFEGKVPSNSNGKCEYANNTVVAKFIYSADGVQEYELPCSGKYKLEVWGAQGGDLKTADNVASGGLGGYVAGEVYLTSGTKLYVAVGGQGHSAYGDDGTDMKVGEVYTRYGGYNGGGNGVDLRNSSASWYYGAGGGGATHIATAKIGDGQLKEYKNNTDKLLIVAGGGGGAVGIDGWNSNGTPAKGTVTGGSGGGTTGGWPYKNGEEQKGDTYTEDSPGTQQYGGGSKNGQNSGTVIGSFGLGGSETAGGGGGLYGGRGSYAAYGAGGGSGYIGNGVTVVSNENGSKTYDGYAQITLISAD